MSHRRDLKTMLGLSKCSDARSWCITRWVQPGARPLDLREEGSGREEGEEELTCAE